MEQIKSEIIDPTSSAPLPSPLSAKECECGCGHSFFPRRRDNIYLNKQHADFAYNHGKRKSKNKHRLIDDKALRKNDNLLDKHFKSEKGQGEIDRFYDILKADGFKSGHHIGRIYQNEKEYHFSYRYMYRIYKSNGVLIINIKKR
jgi:hypothetical protein